MRRKHVGFALREEEVLLWGEQRRRSNIPDVLDVPVHLRRVSRPPAGTTPPQLSGAPGAGAAGFLHQLPDLQLLR